MIRMLLRVGGIVQGVGFRPFIHKRVTEYGLRGWIRNTSDGVEIELEGQEADIHRLADDILYRGPALSRVDRVERALLDGLKHYPDFRIIESRTDEKRATLISPDVGICDDCRRELFDPADRRHRYPFINCTNCGPRFTIIRDVPYDRCKTTMAPFEMCPDCDREYRDITDRRYHAQPDCCGDCGPRLIYLDAAGRECPGDPIKLAQKALEEGGIVAVKGLGGVHLSCLPDEKTTAKLRARKQRDEKPFALMCADTAEAEKYCFLSAEERKALESPALPIVLLRKREKGAFSHISENNYLGVMLPYTPVHCLLTEKASCRVLVMTSANLSDTPIVYKNDEALRALSGIADTFLLNDRDIHMRCDDSLLYVVEGRDYLLRRSRGYAPQPLRLDGEAPPILACGAEQKASFGLTRGEEFFLSGHIGDLKNAETLRNYELQTAHFEHIFDISPRALVCDLHPDYLSTRYAEARAEKEDLLLYRVQHHHAHMASCMADNGLDGEVIGIIWDGVGLGTDGTAWGGEFLVGGYEGFKRAGSVLPFALPGGDRAVKEISRIAYSLRRSAGCAPENAPLLEKMLSLGLNCPATSSIGRLFDGVCAILGIRESVSYEGQGAVLLESVAEATNGEYEFAIIESDENTLLFDHRPMICALVSEAEAGKSAGEMAAKFMNTLCAMAAEICCRIREKTELDRVVLSGGVFQNQYLLRRVTAALEERGLRVWRHCRVSANDEGISLGQAMIAARRMTHVSCDTSESDRD